MSLTLYWLMGYFSSRYSSQPQTLRMYLPWYSWTHILSCSGDSSMLRVFLRMASAITFFRTRHMQTAYVKTGACRDGRQYPGATFKQPRRGQQLTDEPSLSFICTPPVQAHSRGWSSACTSVCRCSEKQSPKSRRWFDLRGGGKKGQKRGKRGLREFTHAAGNNDPPLTFCGYSNEHLVPLLCIVYLCVERNSTSVNSLVLLLVTVFLSIVKADSQWSNVLMRG